MLFGSSIRGNQMCLGHLISDTFIIFFPALCIHYYAWIKDDLPQKLSDMILEGFITT